MRPGIKEQWSIKYKVNIVILECCLINVVDARQRITTDPAGPAGWSAVHGTLGELFETFTFSQAIIIVISPMPYLFHIFVDNAVY